MTNSGELPDDLRAACRKARVPSELWESFLENCPEARLWRQRERDENMLAAHKTGWTTQRIAEELGVSLRTVQLGIRRARTAEVTESPEQRLEVLRRMLARAKVSQARPVIQFLRLALKAEEELNKILGPRPAPAYARLAHGFSEFAREYRRTQELARWRRKNGAIPAQEKATLNPGGN
jgi:hypothetical protein